MSGKSRQPKQSRRNKNLFDKAYRKWYSEFGYTNEGVFTKKALKWALDEFKKEGNENPTVEQRYEKINIWMENNTKEEAKKVFASPKKAKIINNQERIEEEHIVEEVPKESLPLDSKKGIGKGKGKEIVKSDAEEKAKKIFKKNTTDYSTKVEKDTGAIIPPDTEHIGKDVRSANIDGLNNNMQHLNSGDSKQIMNTEQSTQSDLIQLNNLNALNANYGNNAQTDVPEPQLPTESNNVLTPGGILKAPIISIRDNIEVIKQIQEETPAGKIWTEKQEAELKKMFEPLVRQQNNNYRDQLKIDHGISNDYVEKMINASRGVFFDTRKTEPVKRTVENMKLNGNFSANMNNY